MTGLVDALRVIQETAVAAKETQEVDVPQRNATLLSHDGALVNQPHGLPPRGHRANDLESFAALTTAYGSSEESAVFHRDNEVTAVLNASPQSYRDDRVSWTLPASEKYQALTRLAPSPRSHAEFVRFLVQHLRDELEAAAPGLLGVLRNLKFRAGDTQEGDVKQGRESMGRQIEAEVTGSADLPETVLLKVRRWAALDYLTAIECLLVLDVQERKLSLRPLADQSDQAEHEAQGWLHGQIAGAVECPVYFGAP